MDVRAFGKGFEEFYDRVKQEGVMYRRGNVAEVFKRKGRLIVRAEDTLMGQPIEVEADLVVLAVGMVPRQDTAAVAQILKLSQSADRFFLEAHPKLRPVDTASDGIFLAGCCQGPKDIPDTVAQASGAAARASIPLSQGKVRTEAIVSYVDERACRGCALCVEACPYEAIELKTIERAGQLVQVASVNEVICKGCGTCVTACLCGVMQQKSFNDEQLLSMIAVLGERYE
jgi:heterodisulfide reductase subunit A